MKILKKSIFQTWLLYLLPLILWGFILVHGCGDSCHLNIKTDSLPDGVVGEEYSCSFESECGGDDWFLKSGDLPPGISLSSDGHLSGTPTLAGLYTFTIELVDYEGEESLFDDDDDEIAYHAYKGFSILIE